MTDTQPCTCPDCTGTADHTEPEHATVWGREIRTMTAGELGLCGPRETEGRVHININATGEDEQRIAAKVARRSHDWDRGIA